MGKKRLKNVPVLYEGIKKKRSIGLTDVAYENLQKVALASGISTSEFVERWARTLKYPSVSSHG